MEAIIVAENLTKKYGEKVAVNGIDLRVEKGEIFGFLGPNGAGKTTTIRLITTLESRNAGKVTVNGFDIDKETLKAKTSIGVIQQHLSLDNDLTVIENMVSRGLQHKLPKKVRNERIEKMITALGIEEYRNHKVTALSGGWKKRVSIACALIHEPSILFLDEPTVGLDTMARRQIWDMVRNLNESGTTVFLTTHYIEEAEALCNRVAFIDKGNIIALDTPAELCTKVGNVAVEYRDSDSTTKQKYFADRETANEFAGSIQTTGSVIVRATNLEDCFVELTGKRVGGMQ